MSMSRNGREPLYVVRNSPIHGRGVFAARYIRAGTRIVEYTGQRISNREADRRYDDTRMKRHHTFLFTLDKKTVIDGAIATGGGDAIYPGTELAYDYQYERTGRNDAKLEKFYFCKCGAENCRGSIMKPRSKRSRRSTGSRTRRK